jgi:SAM-dependent methyltransferase
MPAAVRILDAGCGTGRTIADENLASERVGIDLSSEALQFAARRGGAHLLQASLSELPFREGTFDAALMLDVIEHCPDDNQVVEQIARTVKTGGVVIVTVPAFQWLWSGHDEALHHLRRYNRRQLRQLIENNGLEIIQTSYFNMCVFPLVAALRLFTRFFSSSDRTSDTDTLPSSPVNSFLYGLQRFESGLMRFVDLPVGVSLIAIARKR